MMNDLYIYLKSKYNVELESTIHSHLMRSSPNGVSNAILHVTSHSHQLTRQRGAGFSAPELLRRRKFVVILFLLRALLSLFTTKLTYLISTVNQLSIKIIKSRSPIRILPNTPQSQCSATPQQGSSASSPPRLFVSNRKVPSRARRMPSRLLIRPSLSRL